MMTAPLSSSPGTTPRLGELTRWDIVALAILAGIICGIQIGKVPPTLHILRAELGIGFITAGWIASLVNICGALFGVASGLVIDRVGSRRVIVLSMLILGGGGVLGPSPVPLLTFWPPSFSKVWVWSVPSSPHQRSSAPLASRRTGTLPLGFGELICRPGWPWPWSSRPGPWMASAGAGSGGAM